MPITSSSRFLTGLLLAAFVSVCILFAPYLAVFVLAIVFGVIAQPLNRALRSRLGVNAAAAIIVIIFLVAILTFLSFVVTQVVSEAKSIFGQLQEGTILPDHVIALIQAKVASVFPGAHIDIVGSLKSALNWLLNQTGTIFQGVASVVVTIFLSGMALFYWCKDSTKLRTRALEIIPLSKSDSTGILDRLSLSVHSLIKGTLVVAVLQGISAGIGFTIFGVPNAFLWASVTVFCALIPTLGTSIVFLPTVVYLVLTGDTFNAVGLTLWGLFAVGLIDNLVGPRLMSRGTNMHPFFTLLAILGGIKLFGPIGIFAGPLLVSLFFAICQTYAAHEAKA